MNNEKEQFVKKSAEGKQAEFGSKNPVSRFFIFYVYKIIKLGTKKPLEYEDLPPLDQKFEYENRFNDFYVYYTAKKKLNWSFSKILIYYIMPHWIFLFLGFFIGNLLGVLYPFLLKALINWFLEPLGTTTTGMLLCSAIFLVTIIRVFVQQHAMVAGFRSTVLINIVFFGIYMRKLENISMKALKYLNINKITNSMSADIIRVIIAALTGHQLFTSPVLILVYSAILIVEIGWVALLGILLMMLIMAFQVYLGNIGSALVRKKFTQADARNKNVNSSIIGIKTIKFNAWENIVKEQLDDIRLKEKRYSFFLIVIRGLVDGFIFVMPLLCALLCIIVYQAIYDDLGLASIFYIILVFNLFSTPARVFFFAMIQTFEARIALARVEESLLYPDQDDTDNLAIDDLSLNKGECEIVNGTFSFDEKWLKAQYERQLHNKKDITETEVEPALYDINFKAKQGEFIAIIGEVGCGKTSLLKALTKALFINKGEVKKNGLIAYIPQEAFLANTTLRENILIDTEFNERSYNDVIKNCELMPDIEILPAGDLTEIGERGINLSGGQKQRVTIARAVYTKADLYIIDDSLSALDAHVGQKIFNNVFKGMIANKTKVMVTHALQYLKDVDRVVYMDRGRIIAQGTFTDLLDNSEAFRTFVNEKKKQEHSNIEGESILSKSQGDNKSPENVQHPADLDVSLTEKGAQMTSGLLLVNDAHDYSKDQLNENEENRDRKDDKTQNIRTGSQLEADKNAEEKGKITKDEERFTGQVTFSIYKQYFSEGGYIYFAINIFLFSIGVSGRIMADWWVGQWSNERWGLSNSQYMMYYLIIAAITLVFLVIRSLTWAHYTSIISYQLFKRLIHLILRKKMSYFDTTPTGQLLNLTSKDTDFADINLPGTYIQAIFMFLQIMGTFILIGISNLILIPFLLLVTLFCAYAIVMYLRASMEMRRLEQLAYSPIISNFVEFYNGLVIYRGLNKIGYIHKRLKKNVNTLLKVFYIDRIAQTFVNLVIQLVIALLIGLVFYLFSAGRIRGWSFVVSATSEIALSFNWILMVPLTINFFMFMMVETAKGMSSVQRLFNNVKDDEMEGSFETPKAPEGWPTNGHFEARNVNVRYREGLPLVLKDLNFDINPAEKIGIVGRTGSGKSTFILALTRILELDKEEKGYIKLDGVPIDSIGLTELRKNMKVIPQDPLLLKGSFRSNIDPYNLYSDEEVIEALKKSLLWESDIFKNIEPKLQLAEPNVKENQNQDAYSITNKDKLNYFIEEAGKNLSIGQKQLVCIARALVSLPKVLLMDEATSNIDPNTDLKLQDIIKKQFVNSTIITIAHRLNTIIQYDRIFVLANGRLVEQGSPLELLQTESQFREMVRENGEEFEKKMLKCAMDKNASLLEEFSIIE